MSGTGAWVCLRLEDRTAWCDNQFPSMRKPVCRRRLAFNGHPTLVHAGTDAAALLAPLRAALAGHEAGASAWDGLLVARVVAPDGACLRAAVVAGLAALRGGRPLPRVWLC